MAHLELSWQAAVYGVDAPIQPREPRVLEVAELAQYLSELFEGDGQLQDVWLRGEVSNLYRSAAGHYYFCLKDEVGQIKSILFRGNAQRSAVLPTAGTAVVAHGRMRFYPPQGSCELIADMLFPEGMGLAQMQFEALYRRLQAEGLFDEARKRPLPAFPQRIGVVTSETGAVIHDLLTVLGRRYPVAAIVLAPSAVQGAGSAEQVVEALATLNAWRSDEGEPVDLIVVARGGGSAEDLATFNEEVVVRAIFGSRAPVVSAVGHEVDVTLADLVADLRAPTPSAAAELIAPDLGVLLQEVALLRSQAQRLVQEQVVWKRSEVQGLAGTLTRDVGHRLTLAREQVSSRRLQLATLSPEATLHRGYAIAELNGRVVRDAAELQAGARLHVRLERGAVDTVVAATTPAEEDWAF
jgi:exodeoxyribonuclease VII large subunit